MQNEFSFPFDATDFGLELCVFCGQVFRWRKQDSVSWAGVDGDYWFEVRAIGISELRVKTNGSREDFERLFRFDWAGKAIRTKIVGLGPELESLIEQLPGLRLMRPSSSIETFFCFLCTPNNHLTRITSMIASLSGYGVPIQGRSEFYRFPRVETIAAIPEAELRSRGFGYRAATIPRAARQLVELGGEAFLNGLRQVPYERARGVLTEISGVGPKLADCICLFGLDHTEAVPVDTHIWQAATRIYFPEWKDSNLTAAKYDKVGSFMRERFGTLAGWAHQYLFFENLLRLAFPEVG